MGGKRIFRFLCYFEVIDYIRLELRIGNTRGSHVDLYGILSEMCNIYYVVIAGFLTLLQRIFI